MAAHSSTLAWRSPRQRSLAGSSPWGYMTEHACTRVEGDGLVAINWENWKKKEIWYNLVFGIHYDRHMTIQLCDYILCLKYLSLYCQWERICMSGGGVHGNVWASCSFLPWAKNCCKNRPCLKKKKKKTYALKIFRVLNLNHLQTSFPQYTRIKRS